MVTLGLRIARLINFPYLFNFVLESERLRSYSHSWRVEACEDTEREVCAGSHRTQVSVNRGIVGNSTGHIEPTSQKMQSF